MTNQQFYLAIGLPTLTSFITLVLVVLAWLSSHSGIKELRTELRTDMDRMERRLEQRFEAIDRQLEMIAAELRYFHGQMGDNAARLTVLEKR